MADEGDLPCLQLPEACREGFRVRAEVQVWLIDIRDLDADLLAGWAMALLGEEEQRRAHAIVAADARRDHMAGRVALRLLLSAYCPAVPPRAWLVSRAEGGRPMAAAPPGYRRAVPSFSISHCEGYLALAFHATGEPGVDIESDSREVDAMGLAGRYFSKAETAMLEALPRETLQTGFLRTWTLKEASVKADGAGLAGELARRWFLWRLDGRIETASPDQRYWQYWSCSVGASRMLAVALRHPAGWPGNPVACREFTLALPSGYTSATVVGHQLESAVV